MKTETNLSDRYRQDNIALLSQFSSYHNNKPFSSITRQDILIFLDTVRKSEAEDSLHKWIGTYNLYRMRLFRFFKWLYYPDIEPDKRPNLQLLRISHH
jgi:hypothetical protein